MADEIAAFFEAEADPVTRLDGIAGHLKRFCDPRTCRALLRHLDEDGGTGLRDSAIAAIQAHREKLTPAAPETSVAKG